MTEMEPTVFLVDDDPAILTSLSRALGERGFQVSAFPSAESFLKNRQRDVPGCLILDQGMPKMTGLELQEVMVNDGIALPIIFITGHGDVPQSTQALRAGAIDFLQKPFRQELLIERIREALSVDKITRKQSIKRSEAIGKFEKLTDREREIASMIISDPASSSCKTIARKLAISHRTVEHHRTRILEKMNVRSIGELVELGVNSQLLTDGD
ncbi:MAG: response regulator [Pseudomonadota bacterium]